MEIPPNALFPIRLFLEDPPQLVELQLGLLTGASYSLRNPACVLSRSYAVSAADRGISVPLLGHLITVSAVFFAS